MKRNDLDRPIEISDLDRTVNPQLLDGVGCSIRNYVGVDAHLSQRAELLLLELRQQNLPVGFILGFFSGLGPVLGPCLAPLPDVRGTLALAAGHHRLDIHGRLRLFQIISIPGKILGHVAIGSFQGVTFSEIIGIDNFKPELTTGDLSQLLELVPGIPDDVREETRQLLAAVIGDLHLVLELAEDVLRGIGDRIETVLRKVHLETAGLISG